MLDNSVATRALYKRLQQKLSPNQFSSLAHFFEEGSVGELGGDNVSKPSFQENVAKLFESSPFEQLGAEIGRMCGEKRESYGNALGRSDAFLAIFWPDGVPVAQYGMVMLYARLFDKLMRIVHDEGAFGEDPWKDIAGYAIQQVYNQREAKQPTDKGNPNREQ